MKNRRNKTQNPNTKEKHEHVPYKEKCGYHDELMKVGLETKAVLTYIKDDITNIRSDQKDMNKCIKDISSKVAVFKNKSINYEKSLSEMKKEQGDLNKKIEETDNKIEKFVNKKIGAKMAITILVSILSVFVLSSVIVLNISKIKEMLTFGTPKNVSILHDANALEDSDK